MRIRQPRLLLAGIPCAAAASLAQLCRRPARRSSSDRSAPDPGRQRPAALTRRRVGGVHRLDLRHRRGQAGFRHLDVELGRQAERAAHLDRRAGAHAPLEPRRPVPRLSLRPRGSSRGGSGLAARPERGRGAAGDGSAGRSVGLRLVARTGPASRSWPRIPTPNGAVRRRTRTKKRPEPIVVDRFRFKYDEVGYIGAERDHLYVFTLESRKARAGHPGRLRRAGAGVVAGRAVHRVPEPAAAGVRPHRQLGRVRRRRHGRCRAAAAHHLRRGRHGSRVGEPAAELESGRQAHRVRAGREARAALLRRAEGRRGARRPAGPARVLTGSLDRNVLSPTFSPDGRSVLFLLEDDRVYHLARVPAAGGRGRAPGRGRAGDRGSLGRARTAGSR